MMRMPSMLLAALLGLLTATGAHAVETARWTHTSEADFAKGRFQRVVATNLGDLKLSRSVQTLVEQDSRISAVYCLAQTPDGAIFAGTGPRGVLLRIDGDAVTDALVLEPAASIFSLATDAQGRLLIGTGGSAGRVLRLDKPGAQAVELLAPPDVQYVWALRVMPGGTVYAATGPTGQLYAMEPDGRHELVLDSNENNLLSLCGDGEVLYAGTDPNGLIYRIDVKTRQTRVLYDAPESEISALAMGAGGSLYAGTARPLAGDEAEAEESAAAATRSGRPEGPARGAPLPAEPPDMPQPPQPPGPQPDEPAPIPPPAGAAQLQESGPGGDEPSDDEADDASEDEDDSADQDEAGEKAAATAGTAVPAGEEDETTNAIYRIDADGFVTEVFRQKVMVLSLLERDGTLLVGTGNEGRIYQVQPAAEETLVLAKVEPRQVMAMIAAADGRVVLGLANVGGVAAMAAGFARDGTFTSPMLDATQVSRFGQLTLHGTLPAGTTLTVATRSGNSAAPDDQAGAQHSGWSQWTEKVSASAQVPVTAPPGRFLQYRLTLGSADGTATPVVDEVSVAYQMPNLSPAIKSLAVSAVAIEAEPGQPPPPPPQGSGVQTIKWEAADPNSDDMRYAVHCRMGSRGPWILLKDDLAEPTYAWDTKLAADGRYEVRVTASDARDNTPGTGRSATRISDPVLVDNTAPQIGNVRTQVNDRSVRLDFTAADRASPLRELAYALDSSADWQTLAPSDSICDELEEQASIALDGVAAGAHQVTMRATDLRGNIAVATVLVQVGGPAAAAPTQPTTQRN